MPARKRPLLAAAVGCLLVAFSSCDENPPPPLVPTPQGPILAFAPDTLFFRAPGDSFVSYLKVRKILEVWNGGTDILYWRVSEDVPWLTFSATHEGSSQGERDTVQVFAWFDQIEEDQTLEADIVVSAGTESRTVRAVATNTMNGWVCASAESLSFDWETARDPKTLQVRSCGGSRMPWTVAANVDWLQLTPRNGESTGEWDDVEVAVDWSRFGDTGTRSAEIEVAGPADSVQVRVTARPSQTLLCVDGESFELDEGTNLGPVFFGVQNCGAGALDWSASANRSWVHLTPASGTSSGEWDSIRVSIDWPYVPYSETQTATITVAGDEREEVLDLSVHPLPLSAHALCVDPDDNSLPFIRWSSPGPLPVGIRNCGEGVLGWNVVVDEPWVHLSPTSGTSTGEWDTVSVSIDWPHTPWFYEDAFAHLEVRSNGGGNFFVVSANDCQIEILEPDAATNWLAGQMREVTWTGHGMSYLLYIALYKGSSWVRNFGVCAWEDIGVGNSGRMRWMVSGYGFGPGSDYRFRVVNATKYSCSAFSPDFTITEPPCFIAVLQPPNCEVNWPVGETRAITWDPTNAGADVSIDLYRDHVFHHAIVSATENDGTYEWLIDDYGGGDGVYRVKITDAVDNTCTGMSDYFALKR